MQKVSLITVNFNQPKITEELLNSIITVNEYPNTEIIVVDNGSSLNNIPQWKEQYPMVNFIRSDTNLGFAGGNNIGIKAASGDYLFLINNDTEFTSSLVRTLLETLQANPVIGMISPKICYFDKPQMLQYAGYTAMNFYTAQNACIGQFETDSGQYNNIVTFTGFIHGAAMMISKTALEKAGLMAENFFLYYEEYDWCQKFRRAGYEIWVNTNALIYHKESISVGKKSTLKEYFMNRNRILFIRRNASLSARLFFYTYFIIIVTPRNILRYIIQKNYNFIPMLFRAIWWNVTNNKNSSNLGYSLTNIK